MRRLAECALAGAASLALSLLLMGSSCPPKPPGPHPTPAPTATPTPVPTPTPTPTPACATLQSFKLKNHGVARTIIDATPGHGIPACKENVGVPCSGNGTFERLSPEGGSNICEQLAGPYEWKLDGVVCGVRDCNQGGNCFSNNQNPLQFVFCKSGHLQVTGGNGAFTAIEVQVP